MTKYATIITTTPSRRRPQQSVNNMTGKDYAALAIKVINYFGLTPSTDHKQGDLFVRRNGIRYVIPCAQPTIIDDGEELFLGIVLDVLVEVMERGAVGSYDDLLLRSVCTGEYMPTGTETWCAKVHLLTGECVN